MGTTFSPLRAAEPRPAPFPALRGFFPAKKPGFLSLFSFAGRSALGLGPAVARFLCGFHLKNKLRTYIVMQLDRDLVFAGIFDRTFKNNLMPVNLRTEFVFDAVHNILRGNRSKGLASLAGLQRKDEPCLTNSAPQFFRLVQFSGFALSALFLQR